VGDRGYLVEATAFANVDHEMRSSQEEIFHGDTALENFTEPKTIWLALDQ
jgi:hypothetical protein